MPNCIEKNGKLLLDAFKLLILEQIRDNTAPRAQKLSFERSSYLLEAWFEHFASF